MDIRKYKEVCFSLDDDNMNKSELYKKQREERGWDDTELFALDVTFGKFMLPRMKELLKKRTQTFEIPDYEIKEFEEIIAALEIVANDEADQKHNALQVQRAMFLFGANFFKLGW